MQNTDKHSRQTTIATVVVVLALVVAAGSLFYSMVNTRTITLTSVQTVTSVSTTISVSTATPMNASVSFNHTVFLWQKIATVSASGYSSLCNCTAPGFWKQNITVPNYPGYILISLSGNTTLLEVIYTINDTANTLTWCTSSQSYCVKLPAKFVVPMVLGADNITVIILNESNQSAIANITVWYRY